MSVQCNVRMPHGYSHVNNGNVIIDKCMRAFASQNIMSGVHLSPRSLEILDVLIDISYRVFMAVIVRIVVFWFVTPCSLAGG
jgi:hypothetical protein